MVGQTAETTTALGQPKAQIGRNGRDWDRPHSGQIKHSSPISLHQLQAALSQVQGEFRKLPPIQNLHEFLCRCTPLSDGFLALSEKTSWRLGAVVMAEYSNGFAVVQKAHVEQETYEFAGLLSLPGGMIRVSDWHDHEIEIDTAQLVLRSVKMRALQEAALSFDTNVLTYDLGLGPLVTSYFAKGKQRFTLIVAHRCSIGEKSQLVSSDSSIDAAMWTYEIEDWASFAPANRLIVAHLRWGNLSIEEQNRARVPVEAAAIQCSAWARKIGLPSIPTPWACSAEVVAWARAWDELAL